MFVYISEIYLCIIYYCTTNLFQDTLQQHEQKFWLNANTKRKNFSLQ